MHFHNPSHPVNSSINLPATDVSPFPSIHVAQRTSSPKTKSNPMRTLIISTQDITQPGLNRQPRHLFIYFQRFYSLPALYSAGVCRVDV
ncbi:hypothetical protein DL95DRAFT_379766, partial [Leptodontidium sp. 2 PMI_412]